MVANIGESGEFVPLDIPLFSDAVPAGFPSPATDYCERKLDLNELCIKRPARCRTHHHEGKNDDQ